MPNGIGLAGAVHRTWAVAEKNDWRFSNPRIDTGAMLFPPVHGGCYIISSVGNWCSCGMSVM